MLCASFRVPHASQWERSERCQLRDVKWFAAVRRQRGHDFNCLPAAHTSHRRDESDSQDRLAMFRDIRYITGTHPHVRPGQRQHSLVLFFGCLLALRMLFLECETLLLGTARTIGGRSSRSDERPPMTPAARRPRTGKPPTATAAGAKARAEKRRGRSEKRGRAMADMVRRLFLTIKAALRSRC